MQTHAASLKKTAGNIRNTGRDVHNAFQALDPVYNGPEERELFDSTIPVRDKADEFAKKLESVGGALQSFATEAKPLVDKMDRLRKEAEHFVAENKGKDDWQKDQKKVDQNARMVSEVGTTWVAFQGVERDAANKITALVGGTKFVVDDGSHKAGMYGFKESDVKDAKETPWGTVDKRKYEGLRAAWEWTKDNVGGALKGFFVDGVWGTIKGLGSMINVFDWDNFKKTWKGIGDIAGGVSAYVMTPYDWAMDKMFGPTDHSDTDKQKAALREFGKSLVAWDEWGKDPARALGTVLFNGLTIGAGPLLKLGKAGEMGQAGKLSAGAKVAGALGKAGVMADPMSYLGKAAGVTKLKVGDFMEGLKASRAGLDDLGKNLPTGTGAHPIEPPARQPALAGVGHPTPEGTPSRTGGTRASDGLHYTDHQGNHRVVDGEGNIRDQHGNIVPDTKPVKEPHKSDLPNTSHEHQAAPVNEPAKVLEGAGGPSHMENAGSHPTSSHPTSTQPTNMHPGDGTHPTGGGTAGPNTTPHTGGGHISEHPTAGGSGSHGASGGGSGSHGVPGSGSGTHGSSGGHHSDGGDTSGSGGHHPEGRGAEGHGGHGDSQPGPGGHDGPQDNGSKHDGHDAGSGNGQGADGSHAHEEQPEHPGSAGAQDAAHQGTPGDGSSGQDTSGLGEGTAQESRPFQRNGEVEQQIRDQLRGSRVKPGDLEKVFDNLAEHPAGKEIGDTLASGRYAGSYGYGQLVSSLSKADMISGAVDQFRLADRLHANGITDIAFEAKGGYEIREGVKCGDGTDLDVLAYGPDGKTYGYQFKEVANPKKLMNKIFSNIHQLTNSHADVQTFVVETKGTLADLEKQNMVRRLSEAYADQNVQFIIRVEDGTMMIPPGGTFVPGGAL
ncbi:MULTISPECIES: hypothetical protein [Streptomyces]|uniref:Uncharacterized protein n=1 Tax=Streptomyces ehimensis TaxID=68195 RepID=A0ABV9BKG9_9ACTN